MRDAVKEIYDQVETLADLFELIPALEPQNPYEWAEWEAQNWEEQLEEIIEQFVD